MDKHSELKNLLADIKVNKYRAIPFWSWNDKLEKEELVNQVKWMKENGFGGYFMHARSGLITEYLSDEWFDCIKACVDAGDECEIESWAYDENGWPSGFVGGKLLEEPNNCNKYLTYNKGAYDKNSYVSYLITEDKLVRSNGIENGEYLNVYVHTSISTADVQNPDVVDKFIKYTHNEYKNRLGDKFGNSLKGFFTDEPQYFRGKQPYTVMIEKLFKDQYSEDILDNLGLLFVEKDGYRDFRYRFWKGMQELLLNNYSKKIYEWCESNGASLTGHYVEETSLEYQMMFCAGIMPFYEYMSIPGIDHLGSKKTTTISSKQVSSVCAQLGKKRVLTETYAGAGWDVSPSELKRIAESQYVNGVNLMCQHLLPYSICGQRKRDYPAHYSWSNPWCRNDFKKFNDYFAKLGYLIGEGKEKVNVAILSPIRSIYFDYKREDFGEKPFEVNLSYKGLADKLSAMNVPFHILDETIMSKYARVKGGNLIVGNCSYDYVIFPRTYTLDKSSASIFEKFYADGGKMLFTDGVPEYMEGRLHSYNFNSNVNLNEILSAQEYSVSDFTTEIRSTLREIDGKKFIYAVNLSKTNAYDFTFSGEFNSFISLYLENGKTKELSKTVHFEPYQSYVLFLNDDAVGEDDGDVIEYVPNGRFKVVKNSGNYLTLDKLRYSFDGVNYSDELRYMGIFDILLNKRYEGDLYLKYTFAAKYVPNSISLLLEDMNNAWCEVNGVRIDFTGVSDFEKKIYKADIKNAVKVGKNEIIVKINFFESEDVYFALFGENVTEGLKNKLYYNTTIESCYLFGDFGVYSNNEICDDATQKGFLIGDEFYIDKQKDVVFDTVKDGYPFFAGSMTLSEKYNYDDGRVVLNLKGRYCSVNVKINGVKVEKSYFLPKIEITDYLKKGENVIEYELVSGNRNLLGPHHYAVEPLGVGPDTYELTGTWKNGVSSKETKEYHFKKFGLFKR